MRETILKAVAMPPRVFWAPMFPALINFSVHSALFFMLLGIGLDPLWVIWIIVLFVLCHIIIVIYSVREPHLSRMLQSQGQLPEWRNKKIYSDKGTKLAS